MAIEVLYFQDVLTSLTLTQVAKCLSHQLPDIIQVEGVGFVWKSTRELVQLDWNVLSSKWEIVELGFEVGQYEEGTHVSRENDFVE